MNVLHFIMEISTNLSLFSVVCLIIFFSELSVRQIFRHEENRSTSKNSSPQGLQYILN